MFQFWMTTPSAMSGGPPWQGRRWHMFGRSAGVKLDKTSNWTLRVACREAPTPYK